MTPLCDQLTQLAARDADLARAVALVGALPDRTRDPGFATLLRIMCDQQLSVASAAAIWARIKAALAPVSPEAVLRLGEADLRALGLSRPKVRYARALAEAVAGGALDLAAIEALDDRAAVAALSAVLGIGRWTAEIYLLFALGRPDIWPADDLALQEAMRSLKRLRARPDRARMDRLARGWRPYRGAAARVLWAYYRIMRQESAA